MQVNTSMVCLTEVLAYVRLLTALPSAREISGQLKYRKARINRYCAKE